MSITGRSSIRRLKDVAVVMDLHELAPVGGRATSGRDGRRLEWLAEVCENLPDRPRSRTHTPLRATDFECAQSPQSSRDHIAIVQIPLARRVLSGGGFPRRNVCA